MPGTAGITVPPRAPGPLPVGTNGGKASAAGALGVYTRLLALGAKPALTWYGKDGRTELSGKVASNHLAKIAGYLADDIWVAPGETVRLDLPAHWKQVLWGLGALLAGTVVSLGRGGQPATVLVTATPRQLSAYPDTAPRSWADGSAERAAADSSAEERASAQSTPAPATEILALDLAPLTFAWSGPPLPPAVHDASAEVLGAPDQLLDSSLHEASNFAFWHERGALTPVEEGTNAPAVHQNRQEENVNPTAGKSGSMPLGQRAGRRADRFITDSGRNEVSRLLLLSPTPAQALAAAAWQLGRGSLVVVECDAHPTDPQTIAQIEGAKIARPAPR